MLQYEVKDKGNKDYIPRVVYMVVALHMMWMLVQVVPFVVEEPMVLGLYLGKQGCTFHTEAYQMEGLV